MCPIVSIYLWLLVENYHLDRFQQKQGFVMKDFLPICCKFLPFEYTSNNEYNPQMKHVLLSQYESDVVFIFINLLSLSAICSAYIIFYLYVFLHLISRIVDPTETRDGPSRRRLGHPHTLP